MLGVGELFGLSSRAARQQGWLVVPLTLAHAFARFLGAIPWLLLFGLVVQAGRNAGAPDLPSAVMLGLPDVIGNPGSWLLTGAGLVLAEVGSWLLLTVVEAGILQMLGAQLGRTQPAEDKFFAEGLLDSSVRALLTSVLAGLLRFIAFASAFGMIIAGMVAFSSRPGVLPALMMTVATVATLALLFVVPALETGFTRAVLVDEGSVAALGNGVLLALRRAGAILPVWFLLVIAQLAVAFSFGVMGATLSSLATGEIWILFLGPRALVWIVALIVSSMIQLVLLGAYAALVSEDAGTLPPPPPRPARVEPVLRALPVADVLPTAGLAPSDGTSET